MSRSPAVHTEAPQSPRTTDSLAENGMRLNQVENDKSLTAMLAIAGVVGVTFWVIVAKRVVSLF